MNFTDDFSKALRWICAASLFLALPIIYLQSIGMDGYLRNEVPSTSKILLNQFMSLLPKIFFWIGVFYVSKNLKAASIGFLIALLGQSWLTYAHISKGVELDIRFVYYWNILISSCVALAVFGWLHFKKSRGLLLGLISIIGTGILYGMNTYEYHEILKKLFELIGQKNLLSIKIPTGENSYRVIYPFIIVLHQLANPMLFILFWFGYSSIKQNHSFDTSLRTIVINDTSDKNTYAIVHWVLRVVVIISMFSILKLLMTFYPQEFEWMNAVRVVTFCFGIYVIASLYRNVLLAFYITKRTYPSWFYIFLNIPIFHFIPWIYLFFSGNKESGTAAPEDILDSIDSSTPLVSDMEQSQKTFEKDGKNSSIKAFYIVILVLAGLLQFSGYNNSLMGNLPTDSYAIFVLLAFLSVALTLWHMGSSKALYYIFTIQSICFLILLFYKNEFLFGIATIFNLVSLVIYYPLFHFDKMKFKSEEEEEIVENNMEYN